jgi:hypothetical protein
VEAGLIRKAQAGAGIESLKWRPRKLLDSGQSGFPRGVEFLVKYAGILAGRNKKVTIDSLEIAIDAFLAGDPFNQIDRCAVAVGPIARRPRPWT